MAKNKVTEMKSFKILSAIVLLSLKVKSQSTPFTGDSTVISSSIPSQVLVKVQKPHVNVIELRASSNFDQHKRLSEVDSLMEAAHVSLLKTPQPIQNNTKEIQSSIEKFKFVKEEDKQVKQLFSSTFKSVQDQYPGLRHALNQNREIPIVTATTKSLR